MIFLMRVFRASDSPVYFTVMAGSKSDAIRKSANSPYMKDCEVMPDSVEVVRLLVK